MKNYQCSKCGTLVQKDSIPSIYSCPKASVHSWQNLGEVGNKDYQCKKCGALVKSNNVPAINGCPKGSVHSWYKL